MATINKNVKDKFKHQIALAKQNKITWEDLVLILDVLTPTFVSLKQLIETLLEELKASLNNQKAKTNIAENLEDEVIKIESEDDDQDAQEMDEIESVSNYGEMTTDELELKDVQIPTQRKSLNQENFPYKVENKLDAETLENEDQVVDEMESISNEQQNGSIEERGFENAKAAESDIQSTIAICACEICEEVFFHKSNLKNHYRFIHDFPSELAEEKVNNLKHNETNQRYSSEKAFSSLSELQEHQEDHTKDQLTLVNSSSKAIDPLRVNSVIKSDPVDTIDVSEAIKDADPTKSIEMSKDMDNTSYKVEKPDSCFNRKDQDESKVFETQSKSKFCQLCRKSFTRRFEYKKTSKKARRKTFLLQEMWEIFCI